MSRRRSLCRCLRRFDGLNAELAKTPNNTASVAFAYDSELVADDVSVYAHIHLWLGEFFEKVRSVHHLPDNLHSHCLLCFVFRTALWRAATVG